MEQLPKVRRGPERETIAAIGGRHGGEKSLATLVTKVCASRGGRRGGKGWGKKKKESSQEKKFRAKYGKEIKKNWTDQGGRGP